LALIVAVAPSSFASASRESSISETTIVVQPACLSACTTSRPIIPAPITSALAFSGRLESFTACIATESGSTIAAFAKSSFSGIGYTMRRGSTMYSANAPCRLKSGVETPSTSRFRHRFTSPRLQYSHSPQYTVESNVTAWPSFRSVTPAPAAATTPEAS
jgi:hypothetical protein